MNDYIDLYIVEPLYRVLGNEIKDPDMLFWDRMKKSLKRCYNEQADDYLRQQLEPIYKRYFYADVCLLDCGKYGLLDFISLAIQTDWNFGYWTNGERLDEAVENWANYSKKSGRGAFLFMHLLECMLASGVEDDWYYWTTKLQEILLKEEVEGNADSSEIYCIFHAFIMIAKQQKDLSEMVEMYRLFCKHWDFFRFLYSVMLRRVIGCRFTNFASVGNNLKNTLAYHPYLHLFYSAMMENRNEICRRGTKQEKLDKSLADIREIIGSTPRSEELDELCHVLFPDRWKEYMSAHRLKSYRELEDEVNEMRKSMDEHTSQMQKLIDEQAEMLRALAETSVPIEVISNELLRLPYGTSYEVFEKLNSLLIADKVWTKNAPEIRNRILERMQQPSVQATNYYAAGANHNDHQKHLHITNDKKQIGQA